MYSKVKIFGHPVHPMLIAYPIAFYTSTLVAFLIYAANGNGFWFKVAVAANVAGVIMAAVAALPGFIDWAVGIPSRSPASAPHPHALECDCLSTVCDQRHHPRPAVGLHASG